MQLYFVATALMITASTSFANSIRDEMIYTDHETSYSFSVTSPDEPVETNNHDEFINQCLLSSYNSIHDPSKYFIDSVTQESEQILPPSFAMSDHDNLASKSNLNRWYYAFISNIGFGGCRMCPPNLVLELSTTWETAFCTCLRGSSDPLMKTAKDCSIERLEAKSQKKDQDYHKIEPLADDTIYTDHETAYSFSVTSSEEPVETNNHDEFINQCLISSYNSIHDPSKYFIDSVTQESEQILPPSFAMSDHNNLASKSNLNRWYYAFISNIGFGGCRMCPPDLVLELSTTWETAFCTCLRDSSDPLMQTAKDCSIERLNLVESKASQAMKVFIETPANLRGAKKIM